MKNLKKMFVIGAAVLTVGATSLTAFAASDAKTPAEIVAGLIGKSVESVIADKNESGKTYGTIAADAGKGDAFKSQMLQNKKAILADRVAAGTMTQEQADTVLAAMAERQANCDGTGNSGQRMGVGFGGMSGKRGQGNGMGRSGAACTAGN